MRFRRVSAVCADRTKSCGLEASGDGFRDFRDVVEVDSRIAWALDPPIPNEFTLILSGLPEGHGVGSKGTWRFASLNGIWGFGVLK